MKIWNITNIVRFEYFIEAETASDAIKEAFDSDADEVSESWHATDIGDDDDDFDDDLGEDDDIDEDEDIDDDDGLEDKPLS